MLSQSLWCFFAYVAVVVVGCCCLFLQAVKDADVTVGGYVLSSYSSCFFLTARWSSRCTRVASSRGYLVHCSQYVWLVFHRSFHPVAVSFIIVTVSLRSRTFSGFRR